MTFYDLIQACLKASGTKEKKALVLAQQDNSDIKELFRLMLDPGLLYNIKKVPQEHGWTEHEVWFDKDDELIQNLYILLTRDNRGDALKYDVQWLYDELSNPLRDVLTWVLDRKNPAKVGKSIVNSVWPGLIYEQSYQGAVPGTEDALLRLPWSDGINVQTKEDGMSLLVHYKEGLPVALRTRQGQDITKYFPTFLAKAARTFTDFTGLVHHEAFVYDSEDCTFLDRKTGNGLISKHVKNGNVGGTVDESLRSVLLDLKDDNYLSTDQEHRYEILKDFETSISNIVSQIKIFDLNTARMYAQEIIRHGGEGVICKLPSGVWKDGKPWYNVKIKNEFAVELKVIDYKEHSKRAGQIGSVLCASEDGILEVWVNAKCDADRELDYSTFWHGSIVQVKAESIIKSKGKKKPSLYLPRFDGDSFNEYVRDKAEADSYARIKEQEKASKGN